MVALVTTGVDGTALAVHRTFLARDGGGKAPVDPQKMMLGPCRGGAVRLADPGARLRHALDDLREGGGEQAVERGLCECEHLVGARRGHRVEEVEDGGYRPGGVGRLAEVRAGAHDDS